MKILDPIIEKRNLEMVKMKEEGYSINQIGKFFNLTKQNISYTLKLMRGEKRIRTPKN